MIYEEGVPQIPAIAISTNDANLLGQLLKKEVVSVYTEQLSLGKRSLLDLLDVKKELLRARVAYVNGQ